MSDILLTDMTAVCSPGSILSGSPQNGKWRTVRYETRDAADTDGEVDARGAPAVVAGISGCMISSSSGSAPDITINLKREGWYAVYVGVGPSWKVLTSARFRIRLSGDPCFTTISLLGQESKEEIVLKEFLWKREDLTGQDLVIRPLKETHIAYVRLVPLSESEAAGLKADSGNRDTKRLIAFKDARIYQNAKDKSDLLETVEAFRDSDFRALCQMVARTDACEYPTKIGYYRKKTRDVMEKISPGAVPFMEMMEHAHRIGLDFYAYVRMAFRLPYEEISGDSLPVSGCGLAGERPELMCQTRDGTRVVHLSYAYPEVRERVVSVIREIAEYGVDGINLAFTRGPVYVLYEKPVIESFKKEHGVDPREIDDKDERWLKHRAGYMTELVRDVRKTLKDKKSRNGKSITLSALLYYGQAENLLHGLDVDTWIEEGLIDELMPQTKIHYMSPIDEIDMTYYSNITKNTDVRLYPGPWINGNGRDRGNHGDNDDVVERAKLWYRRGADGLSFWDITDGVQEICYDMEGPLKCRNAPLWNVLKRLGHRDELTGIPEKEKVRCVPLKSLDGWDVSHVFEETGIRLIIQQGGG